MDLSLLHAGLPVACLALNVLVQLLWYRITSRRSLLRSIYVGFLAGAAGVTAGEAMLALYESGIDASSLGYVAANILLYGALGYGYFHFINLGETGRRVRLMWELRDAPVGYTEVELVARYSAKEITEIRMGRLLRSGQVVLNEGRYRIGKPTVLTMARILITLKRLLLKKSSEFD